MTLQALQKPHQRFPVLLATPLIVTSLLTLTASLASADAVTDWNRTATTVGTSVGIGMPQTRLYAMVHIAIYDAVNSIERRGTPYAIEVRATAGASLEAAIAAAARDVLFAVAVTQRPAIEAAYEKALDGVPNPAGREAGIAIGRRTAAAILARREGDGSGAVVSWPAGAYPGQFRPVPPQNLPAAFPAWGRVTPFAMRTGDQFRSAPPMDLYSDRYAVELNEVRLVGAEDSKLRTDEQSEIARYWYEGSVQGWNRIARNLADQQTLGLWRSARLFALINVALADGYVGSFESKYYYNFWRPITGIREGFADGNIDTEGDPEWNSFLATPNFPEWPSAHAVEGAAAAAVMAGFFGTDYVPFNMISGPPNPGIARRFYGFGEAAVENADSRVLAGIHFRSSVVEGLSQGRNIGQWVLENFFRPLR